MTKTRFARGAIAAPLMIVFVASGCNLSKGEPKAAPRRAPESSFVSLFDGQTLQGWDGNTKFWRVEDGAITGQTTRDNPTRGNTFIIWSGGDIDDFELKLEYRIVGGNSGIQYRSWVIPGTKWVIGGYQADFEAGNKYSGALYGEKFRGMLAARGEKTVVGDNHKRKVVAAVGDSDELQSFIKKEDWNEYHIIARGNHFIQKINGRVTAELTDEDQEMRRDKGLLALQLHAGKPMKVQFRNIRLRRLKKADRKKIVFIAGKGSHRRGAHEHNAGSLLLAKALNAARSNVRAVVHLNGWPQDPQAFADADAVVIYCDGGKKHMVNRYLKQVDALMKKGVGIACLHYGVEVPQGESGDYFLDWLGGYFEANWSVNPHWDADFKTLPDHPITRGVKPFKIHDEWYYHMRFRPQMAGVTPILSAHPPKETLKRRDGAHSGNPHVRAAIARGEIQHVAWATERPDGGRGFGFTGGHFHRNWQNDNFRKLMLNAILWIAKADVPASGVHSLTPTQKEMEINQDEPKRRGKRKKKAAAPPRGIDARQAKSTSKLITSRDPDNALAGLDVGAGLEAKLFASEPMILSLTNLDIDHRGRVWVSEVVNYRHFRNKNNPVREQGDRILILEDIDGDGKADTSKVFYQGTDINGVMGLCVLGNKVIVSSSPNVFVLTDTDGDDKADKKELLFTKISGKDHDHAVHAFVFGPDGKLYFNFGNHGRQIHDAQGQPIVDLAGNRVVDNRKPYIGGMVFRCNLDGSEFETLGHNFRNNYEVTVDSFGTLWQSDNDDDGNRGVRINYVMEFGNFGYKDEMTGAGWRDQRTGMHAKIPQRHWRQNDPGVVPNLLITGGGSPTGICVYEGDLLPAVFRNQLIHADAGPGIVRAYPVTNDGAGYRAQSVDVLKGTRDRWFRPSDVCVAPDGSLMIADWYDSGVGGHRMGDQDGRGRLFLIAPPGHKYRAPKFDFRSAAGATAALTNPNSEARYLAWTALHKMGRRAERALLKLWRSENARHRARALWLLGKIDGRGRHYVDLALKDADPNIRITGLRLARQIKLKLIPLVAQLVHDPSPQVRRECAIALRHNKSPRAADLWAELALRHDGKSRWYLEALGIGADGQWESFFAAWRRKVRLSGNTWNTPAGRDIIWRSRAKDAMPLLARIISDRATAPGARLRYFRAFDFHRDPAKKEILIGLLTSNSNGNAKQTRALALKHLGRVDLRNSPRLKAIVGTTLESVKGTEAFVDLVKQFTIRDHNDELMQMALSEPRDLAVKAARQLLRFGQQRRFLAIIRGANKNKNENEKAARRALTVLGYTDDKQAVNLLASVITGSADKYAVSLRSQAVKALGLGRTGEKKLLELVRTKKLPAELNISAANVLLRSRDKRIRGQAARYLKLPAARNNKPLPPIKQLVRRRGAARSGHDVFRRACLMCHKVNGQGIDFGPDLSEIGRKLSREGFYESILDPSAAIAFGYEGYLLTMKDGSVALGYIVSETDTTLTLRQNGGITSSFRRADIVSRTTQQQSLMLPNLQQTMTVKELTDLVEYLTTLRHAAM